MHQNKLPKTQGAKLARNLSIIRPVILVLAEGKTDGDRSNEKGHLFEKFVAILLEVYGFEEPREPKLNVSSNGIELDVVTAHRMTKQRAIAECKAYSRNLAAKDLSAFYGKVQTERFDDPSLTGFFVAIPGLTAEGIEQYQKISARDKTFHLLTADEIFELLKDRGLVGEMPQDELLRSDLAIVITRHGTYSAAKVLDPKTRLATSVQVWGGTPVPEPVLSLIGGAEYASGLLVTPVSGESPPNPFAPPLRGSAKTSETLRFPRPF